MRPKLKKTVIFVEIDLQVWVNRSGLENTDFGLRRSKSEWFSITFQEWSWYCWFPFSLSNSPEPKIAGNQLTHRIGDCEKKDMYRLKKYEQSSLCGFFFSCSVSGSFRSISFKIPQSVAHIFPANNMGIWLIGFARFKKPAISPPFGITYKYKDFRGVLR